MPFRLSRRAVADLRQIYADGGTLFGAGQADRYLDRLRSTFGLLADNPRLARERREFDPPIRVHPCASHIIVYRIVDNDVLILRVRHGHEDWAADPVGG